MRKGKKPHMVDGLCIGLDVKTSRLVKKAYSLGVDNGLVKNERVLEVVRDILKDDVDVDSVRISLLRAQQILKALRIFKRCAPDRFKEIFGRTGFDVGVRFFAVAMVVAGSAKKMQKLDKDRFDRIVDELLGSGG